MAKRVTALALALAAGLSAHSASAARPVEETVSAGVPGQIVDLPSGRGEGELFSFDSALAPALLATRPEESLRVEDWPFAPGVRRAVVLSRREIYAPDAKIFRVDGKTLTEVPRSTFAFFVGEDAEGAGNRLMVSVDPATGTLAALMHGPEGVQEISRDASGKVGRHVLARPQQPPGGGAWTCGQKDSIETSLDYGQPRGESALAARAPAALTSLHSAVVAIDTDNEYMAYRSNNTTTTTNYIASLLASINVMYERDLKLRLLQGTTFLRTSADPYSAVGNPNANGAELSEFTDYWNTSYPRASYPRSVAAMLSGKQSSTNSASGIAWLAGSVCGTSTDYSFSQLFKVSYLAGDTMILGHEIGHNLGSPHTHCYANPAPDRCYAGESCYSGPTSCPSAQTINGVPNVTGTLMGYCHVSGIAGCGTSLVFHPSTISRYVGPTLDTGASSGCLAVVGGGLPPSVSSIAPSSGSTLGGTAVTITGASFVNGATLSIGGVAATSVSFVNATTLTAVTGAHAAGTVSVVVMNPDLQTATKASAFTYLVSGTSGTPAVTFPTNGSTLTASTQTLAWTAVSGTLSYEVLLTDVTAGKTELRITVFAPGVSTIYSMHSSTQYQLKVRACQATCGAWGAPVTFAVALPAVPTAAPGITGCTVSGGNSLTCNWNAVARADLYHFYVVQPPPAGPGGGALTVAARVVSATTATLPVPAGVANVIVAACNGDGCGPFSPSVGINPAGPNPTMASLGTPLGGAVVSGPAVMFSWNRVPGDNGSNTVYRLFVQDLSRQATALDVYTTQNFWSAVFMAEGARYDGLVIARPGPSQVVGPAQGFNVSGVSASAPTMVSPGHQSSVMAGNVQVGWSPVLGAGLYQYYIAAQVGGGVVTGVTPGLAVQVPLGTVGGVATPYSGIARACPSGTTCTAGSNTGWGPWSNAPGGPGVTNFTVTP